MAFDCPRNDEEKIRKKGKKYENENEQKLKSTQTVRAALIGGASVYSIAVHGSSRREEVV